MTDQREKFEAAVVERLKESGFLEIQIRKEALVRCGDDYQDEVINAGWHYWNEALRQDTARLSHVACPCTLIEQDEDCPVGHPSMVCGVCNGIGSATQEQVTALACEMMKIASDAGEPEDPFAAWESIDLIKRQHEKMMKALGPFAEVANRFDGAPVAAFLPQQCWFTPHSLREARAALPTPSSSASCRGSTEAPPPETYADGVDIPRLPRGTAVTKVLGYPFPGTVVSAFHTLSGQERFVVEATGEAYRGMLHIFNGDQLRVVSEGKNNG